jgi:MoaA/NifB/PqqE/SkfB family radical SAM enzyme
MLDDIKINTTDLEDDQESEFNITDRSLMMIFLLEACNFSCKHCVREDEPMALGYKLSFEQLELCLADCHNLPQVKWVHFSGGEPTLWTDGQRDLPDLLVEISQAGFEPGFTTNGSNFEDYDKCRDLLQKYVERADQPLNLYLSIDTFHNNFDVEKGRSTSLDNVVKFKGNMSPERRKLLNVTVISVISKAPSSLLPDEMIEHYSALGVRFNFTPLQPKGKARSFAQLCPDPGSDKPEDLGAYYRFRSQEPLDNTAKSSNLVLIGNDYYLPDPWRKVGSLGKLPEEIINAYLDRT